MNTPTHSQFPKAIEIQTISACNAACVICPHPQVSNELPKGVMSMDLFTALIDQIEPRWGTRIIPYLNSEPLLDRILPERLAYIAKKLPGNEIELSTNVSILNPSRQNVLTGIPITDLRLSVFGWSETVHKAIMPGLSWEIVRGNLDFLALNTNFRNHIRNISITMIEHPLLPHSDIQAARAYCEEHGLGFNLWGFLDRSANVAGYSNEIYHTAVNGCEQNRPLERMHVTFTGEVILCCQDWRWKNIIGNVKDQGIVEIWNSPAYQEFRHRIYGGGDAPEVCKRCKLAVA